MVGDFPLGGDRVQEKRFLVVPESSGFPRASACRQKEEIAFFLALGTVKSANKCILLSLAATVCRRDYHLHFSDGKTEAQRKYVTCFKSLSS